MRLAWCVFAVLCLAYAATAADAAAGGLPARERVQAPLVSSAAALEILGDGSKLQPSVLQPAIASIESTPELQELARGLRNDADLIFEYVYNEIEYTPIFGSNKGAVGALLDGTGNDFDQASLMIALLRESGYTANFVYGVIRVDPASVTNWLGIDNNPSAIGTLLGSAGIPAQVWTYPDSSLAFVDIDHVWVKVDIGGTDYIFDPSLKTHSSLQSIDLATAMGYNQSTFLTDVLSGATVTSDYVQNVNESNLGGSLTTYATNLIGYLKANHPSTTLREIIGGNTIQPHSGSLRQAAHPLEQSIISEFADVPTQYRTSLRVQHRGIDQTLYSDSISGKRLTIFYNGSNQPVLRLDGVVLDTGSAATPGTSQDIDLTIDHPYAANGGTYVDQSGTIQILAGGSYQLMNGWSETRSGSVARHQKKLQENLHAGGTTLSEPVLGESLAIIGSQWLAEASLADGISDALTKVFTIHHHTLGVAGQNTAPYVDIPLSFVSVVSGDSDPLTPDASFFSGSGHHSVLEWGVIDQLQPISAVSTVKLIDISNSQSDKIFDASSANYFSVVKPQLINYSAFEYSYVEAYINAGFRVILPQDGDLNESDWTGIGFISISPAEDQIGHIISGGLSGGFGSLQWILDGFDSIFDTLSDYHLWSNEPIDLVTGDYLYFSTDLTIGSASYPFGLEFKRSYNSGARLNDRGLGLGWTHNFDVRATVGSDGFQGLGEDSPIDAAAAIVEQFVSIDLLKGSKTKERVVIATLAHRWFMDRLIRNVVTVNKPGSASEFVELADGTFHGAPGSADLLTQQPDTSYQVQTKHGVVLDFAVDGLLTTWQNPNGNTVTFSYSGGELQSVSNNFGRALSFVYTGSRITQVNDGNGRSFAYGYDPPGNLTSSTDANLEATTYEYDSDGVLARIKYPSDPVDPFVTNVYDSIGRVKTQTDASGNQYAYYFAGPRAEEVDPSGNSRTWYFTPQGKTERAIDALGFETAYVYDADDRLVNETSPEGDGVQLEYDDKHNVTRAITTPKTGSTETPLETVYTYDPTFNRIQSMLDPLLRTTSFVYDGMGNVEKVQLPAVNSVIPETTFTYNAHGQVLTARDAELTTTGYGYDPVSGDLVSTTVDQGGLDLVTALVYDAVGNRTQITDPRLNTTLYQFDSMRRLKQINAPAPQNYITKYTYNPVGKLTKIERETGDPQAPWQTTTITYTPTLKEDALTDPQLNTVSYEYDVLDRLWRVTDAEGRVTETNYDANGRPNQVIDAGSNVVADYGYTPNGHEQSILDSNGNLTSFGYDDFDRLQETTYPDLSFETYSYDDAHNQIQKRKRSGGIIAYSYDDLNRLDTVTLPGGSRTFSYDLAGRITEVTDASGTILHTFDSAGRLSTATYPGGRTVGYEYDENGNRAKLTYPDTYFITYEYDELNRLVDILEGGVTSLVQYAYDPLSRRTSNVYANGTFTSFEYEVDDDLKALTHQFASGGVTFSYAYDDVHNRTSSSWSDNQFDFDVSVDSAVNYAPNVLNQYSSVDAVAFSYDGNGNLSSNGINTYSHDAENRLVTASTPAHNASYAYDPFGRRIGKTVDGVTTTFVFESDQIIADYDALGQMIRRYVYGPGVDEAVAMTTGSGQYFFHLDGLGSSIGLSDDTGMLVDAFGYGPYGEPSNSGTIGNPYLYTGRQYDAETGLFYYRARYYDPTNGRFLETDPIGYVDGTNLYGYVGNNPPNNRDPWGLLKVHIWERRGRAWGHASLTLDDGTHISWWPDSPGRDYLFGPWVSIYSGPAIPEDEQQFEDDVRLEGRDPDRQIVITNLDEAKIKTWWLDFKKKNQWKTFSQNCSTTVADALKAGGAGSGMPFWDMNRLLWRPKGVEGFAEDLKRRDDAGK